MYFCTVYNYTLRYYSMHCMDLVHNELIFVLSDNLLGIYSNCKYVMEISYAETLFSELVAVWGKGATKVL